MVQQGLFREDLYYRLNLFDLIVPPLRERLADIPLLSYSIIYNLAGPERAGSLHISKEVLFLFSTHPWRGNVRELRNILTYALYSMKDSETELSLRHLPERFFPKADAEFLSNTRVEQDGSQEPWSPVTSKKLRSIRSEAEHRLIMETLEKCGGNKSRAARILGIARSCLYNKLAAFRS